MALANQSLGKHLFVGYAGQGARGRPQREHRASEGLSSGPSWSLTLQTCPGNHLQYLPKSTLEETYRRDTSQETRP